MILKPISLILADVLEKNANILPLSKADQAKLLLHLPDGEETLLTIKDNLNEEWVRLENKCGTAVVSRGLEGVGPYKFPRGSCVVFETNVPVMKWLVCNYECCGDDTEPYMPLGVESLSLPQAKVQQSWQGEIVLSGSLPIDIDLAGVPNGMVVEKDKRRLILRWVPDQSGTYVFVISAKNSCRGGSLLKQFIVEVTT